MNDDIVNLARSMYDACPTVKPDWNQLGEVTRGVWIERARAAQDTSCCGAPDEGGSTRPHAVARSPLKHG